MVFPRLAGVFFVKNELARKIAHDDNAVRDDKTGNEEVTKEKEGRGINKNDHLNPDQD